MDKKLSSYYWVGKISSNIRKIVDFKYTGVVYMNYGVIRHVLKKHKGQLSKKNLKDTIGCIKMVIKSPDYIGTHPEKLHSSIEFVKYIHDNNILVAVEVDKEDGYIYVSSMYPITDLKLESRIYSGRVKKVNFKF